MKIFSPIGNVPFTPNRLYFKGGNLVIEGSMGAWPTTVHVNPKDVISIARLLRYPLIILGILLALIIFLLVK
jgi:hypothetical protein